MRGDIAIVPEGRRIFPVNGGRKPEHGCFFINDKAEKIALMDEVFNLFPV